MGKSKSRDPDIFKIFASWPDDVDDGEGHRVTGVTLQGDLVSVDRDGSYHERPILVQVTDSVIQPLVLKALQNVMKEKGGA